MTETSELSNPELDALIRRTLHTVAETIEEPTPTGSWIGDEAVDFASPVVPLESDRRSAVFGDHRRVVFQAAAILVALGLVAAFFTANRGPEVAAASGTWSEMAPSPLSPRFAPSAVWTGTELVVFGGWTAAGQALTDGAAYNPTTDRWQPIADLPIEAGAVNLGRDANERPAVWLDDRIYTIHWSDQNEGWEILAFDSVTDSWESVSSFNPNSLGSNSSPPIAHLSTLLAWQGRLVVVGHGTVSTGWAIFDPSAPADRAWTPFTTLADDGVSFFDRDRSAIVDDRYLVAVSPDPMVQADRVGFLADLTTGQIEPLGLPSAADDIWYELQLSEAGFMVGLAATDDGGAERVAYRFDLEARTFVTVTPPSASSWDETPPELVAIEGGHVLIGGLAVEGVRSGGLPVEAVALAADADMARWSRLPVAPISLERVGHVVVWTGQEVLVWGGAALDPAGSVNVGAIPLVDGARYRP